MGRPTLKHREFWRGSIRCSLATVAGVSIHFPIKQESSRLATSFPFSKRANGKEPPRVGPMLPLTRAPCDVRRRAVNFRCDRYLVDARSGFRSGCGQPQSAFRERPREQKTRASHHGSQTCIGYRGYRCDCLPGLGPGGTPAFDLNDCDGFSWCAREKTYRRGGS